jgi:hypothetical protein
LDNQLKFPALIVCKRSLPTSKDGESDKVWLWIPSKDELPS